MTLHLVGMGLGSVNYLTKGALEAAARSDKIYLDTYTSPIDESLLNHLRREFGEKLIEADRSLLEEGASRIVEEAGEGDVCVLVPGDPLIATTHLTLILEAARRGIGFRIVHGVSAHTALISSSLLQAYKFGRTVTIPRSGVGVETCYRAILENMERGLHTLILLDTAGGGLRIPEALRMLAEAEEKLGRGLITDDRLVICLARIGFSDEFRWAGPLGEAMDKGFPPPPHSLIFPGILHFAEAEALVSVLKASREIVERHKPIRCMRSRVQKYVFNVEQALKEMKLLKASSEIREVVGLAEDYLEDSRRFLSEGRLADSLAAISYAEGLLDSLRIMGLAEFSWPR